MVPNISMIREGHCRILLLRMHPRSGDEIRMQMKSVVTVSILSFSGCQFELLSVVTAAAGVAAGDQPSPFPIEPSIDEALQ